MIIRFVMIVVLTVGVVATPRRPSCTGVGSRRGTDGAAIVAAQYAAEDAIYAGPELPISASRTRDAVADYVSRNGLRQRFEGFDSRQADDLAR